MENVLRISEAANLAIHALGWMAARGKTEHHAASDVARELDVSESHLAKVMQRLAKAGLVTSSRGARGGFLFARDPAAVTVLEVLEAIDGPLNASGCLLGKPVCKPGTCVLKGVLHSVEQEVVRQLGRIRLTDFVMQPRRASVPLEGGTHRSSARSKKRSNQ